MIDLVGDAMLLDPSIVDVDMNYSHTDFVTRFSTIKVSRHQHSAM